MPSVLCLVCIFLETSISQPQSPSDNKMKTRALNGQVEIQCQEKRKKGKKINIKKNNYILYKIPPL